MIVVTNKIKSINQVCLSVVLPCLFFINLSYNVWLWCSIQNEDTEWGIWARAIGSLSTFLILPFNRLIEKASFKNIIGINLFIIFAATLLGLFSHAPIIMGCSVFMFSVSSYILMFKAQLEHTISKDGAHELRKFVTLYGVLCMISPWLAALFSNFFVVATYWFLLFIVLLPICLYVFYIYNSIPTLNTNIDLIKDSSDFSTISLYNKALNDKFVWVLIKQSIIFSGTMNLLNIVIPLWSIDNSWSPIYAGNLILASGLSSLIIRLFIHKIKFSTKSTFIITQWSSWLCAITFIFWPFVTNYYMGYIFSIAYGCFYGIGAPLSLSLYVSQARKKVYANAIWSIRSITGGFLAVSSPLLLGFAVKVNMLNTLWSGFSFLSLSLDFKNIYSRIRKKF